MEAGKRAFQVAGTGLAVLVGLAVGGGACTKAPPEPPPFSVTEAAGRLATLSLDDGFFQAMDELKARAGTDPEAAALHVRTGLAAAGLALSAGHPAARRLLGAEPADRAMVGKYLAGLGQEAAKGPATVKDLGPALATLAVVFGGTGAGDLGPVLALAATDGPGRAGLRLVLGRLLLTGLRGAADAAESDRGPDLLRRVPGLPNAMTRVPAETAFPRTLAALAALLDKGAGTDAALAPGYKTLVNEARTGLGDRLFPVPVGMDLDPAARAPAPQIVNAYTPLLALTLGKDGLSVGSRPAFRWNGGKPDDAGVAAGGWPGAVVAPAADLEAGKGDAADAVKAAVAKAMTAIGPLEPAAYKAVAGQGALALERKDRGLAAFVAIDGVATPAALKGALAAADVAGVNDLRLAAPGVPGAVVPVFFRTVPKLTGADAPGTRLIVAVGAAGADLYPPAKGGDRLAPTGWPEGAKATPTTDGKHLFKLSVAWAADKGYAGGLAAAVGALRKGANATGPVDVVVAKDAAMPALLDAAGEIEAAPGDPFGALAAFFPGLSCATGARCPATIPILFSGAALPKPPKAEDVVKEDQRPAGFCEKGAVQRVVLGRSGSYRACYEAELQRHPELGGRVELRFTIEPDGSVSGVAITANDVGSPAVAECIVKQVKGLQFPKPDGGICVIRWPFKFQPGG